MAQKGAYKRYCHVCWYSGRCWRIALAGSFQSATNWGGIIGAGLLAFGLSLYGRQMMPAEGWAEIVIQGLLYIVAAWVVIFFARLFFVAPFLIHREGEWHGTTFVYREPKLAFHLYARPQNNNVAHRFTFRDAPPHSVVRYRIDFDAGSRARELISACVAGDQSLPNFTDHKQLYYTKGGARVNKHQDMRITTFMRADADPFSVRVYVTGYDIGDDDPPPPTTEPPPPAYWGSGSSRQKPDQPSVAWIHWPLGLGDHNNWQGTNVTGAIETASGEYVFTFAKELDARTLVAQPVGETPPFRVVSATAGALGVKFDEEPSVIKIRFDSK
jgi:hypothetical protein